jgi:hypothetical protein
MLNIREAKNPYRLGSCLHEPKWRWLPVREDTNRGVQSVKIKKGNPTS